LSELHSPTVLATVAPAPMQPAVSCGVPRQSTHMAWTIPPGAAVRTEVTRMNTLMFRVPSSRP